MEPILSPNPPPRNWPLAGQEHFAMQEPWRALLHSLLIASYPSGAVVRARVCFALVAAGLAVGALSGCGPRKAVESIAEPPPELRAAVDDKSPYAGEWAAETRLCSDTSQLWTIEANRMGVRADMRFCVWGPIASKDENGQTVWRAEAACKYQGHDTRDYVFFRLDPDWKQMRVTFNDASPVSLVRCQANKL
jgi:hypothetical protein